MITPTDKTRVVGSLVDEAAYLESLLQDLAFARQALDEMGSRRIAPVASQPIEDVDPILVALWHAAATAYARCFSQGARRGIAERIKPSDEDQLRAHREITEMRGDHIGHLARGTVHERLEGWLELGEATTRELAVRFGIEGHKTLLPSADDVRRYRGLIDSVRARTEALKAAANERITVALRELGGEELQRAVRDKRSIRLD